MAQVTPFLCFDDQAEEVRDFYVTVFRNSHAGAPVRHGDAGPGPNGAVMTAAFELDGQEFVTLNGGQQSKSSRAISFVVNCDTQSEVDEYWERLSAGGETQVCGWLRDRYGVFWQVVPRALPRMLVDAGASPAARVTQATRHRTKIEIAALERAHAES